MSQTIEICAVGDVMINRPEPSSIFDLVRPIFESADIAFGNCESTYSVANDPSPYCRSQRPGPAPENALALKGTFDVMSFANNHHLDRGDEAFFDTLGVLHSHQIETCGAGANLAEARRPAIVERGATRVAFLGYTSILFPDYEAREDKPGAVPLRASTAYEHVEIEQPGSPPRIVTSADPTDLAFLVEDVHRAREVADVVIVTPHWGLHFSPADVADYEIEIAHAAIDAGADLVLGHHQHIVKPFQIYKGKVIAHGMGNFALDVHLQHYADHPHFKQMASLHPHHEVAFRPDYPTYPFHPDSRHTMIVRVRVTDGAVAAVSYVPCLINQLGQPEPLLQGDRRFDHAVDYMRAITAAVGFDVTYEPAGNEIVVCAS